jgi:hypothetical protein
VRRPCVHKLQFRGPRFTDRRRRVREVLCLLATTAPDPFVMADLAPIFRAASGRPIPCYSYWTAFQFIRQRGFVNVERLGKTRHRFELSEQAIRWLDWTGFDWSRRRVA